MKVVAKQKRSKDRISIIIKTAITIIETEGLESLTTIERVRYYIDTRRCKYKNQSKIVHNQVDKKQLREDSIKSGKLKGKASSITYCVASFLLYLTLTNGQKQ